jgi:hypothetical protein
MRPDAESVVAGQRRPSAAAITGTCRGRANGSDLLGPGIPSRPKEKTRRREPAGIDKSFAYARSLFLLRDPSCARLVIFKTGSILKLIFCLIERKPPFLVLLGSFNRCERDDDVLFAHA